MTSPRLVPPSAACRGPGDVSLSACLTVELDIRSLGEGGLMDISVVSMMNGVRGFFRFAHIDGLIPADPAVHARLPKEQRDESRTQGWTGSS